VERRGDGGGGGALLAAGAWCLAAVLALEALRGLLLYLWEPPAGLLEALTAAGLALTAAGGALLFLGALGRSRRRGG
jgi:hypothetical protein